MSALLGRPKQTRTAARQCEGVPVNPALSPNAARGPRCWIAVACGEHVRRGVAGGFMQVCHGKAAPLRRMQSGDRVVYYAPTASFRGADTLQAFTALGTVLPLAPYPFDMGGGFVPWRRDVCWDAVRPAPIRPLLDQLDFTKGLKSWATPLRFGLLAISDHDLALIASAMGAASRFMEPPTKSLPLADDGLAAPVASGPHSPSLRPGLPAR